MNINFIATDIAKVAADAVIVYHYQGQKGPSGAAASVDKALGGAITALIKEGNIKGKAGQVTHLYTLGKIKAGHVIVAGMGKPTAVTANAVRNAVAEACRYLRPRGVKSVVAALPDAGGKRLTVETVAQAATEGAMLGLYTFRKYLTKKERSFGEIKKLVLAGRRADRQAATSGIERGTIISEAVAWARDLVNEPGNKLTPTVMAEAAQKLAEDTGLEVDVWEPERIKEAGMGALLGVAQGSVQPPRFIVMNYKGSGTGDIDIALVGKGITFDTGGINLKGSEWMLDMEGDMAGGASVLAAIGAIARLKMKINVMAVVPATENMPAGNALKPGDILTAKNGKTIEVLNTDAEGRLILSDALCYAVEQGAKAIVDVATLTGSCMAALGTICTGVFANNQPLADKLVAAGKKAGENMWQFPMDDEYREQIKSGMADIKNIGGKYGGAITAAKFLEEFVSKKPWVHLDIAGTSDTDKTKGYQVKGATGVPVRTLVNLVETLAKKK